MSDSIDAPKISNLPVVTTVSGGYIPVFSASPTGNTKQPMAVITPANFASTFGGGTVTSVGVTGANGIIVTGSPITTNGAIALSVNAADLKNHLQISSQDVVDASVVGGASNAEKLVKFDSLGRIRTDATGAEIRTSGASSPIVAENSLVIGTGFEFMPDAFGSTTRLGTMASDGFIYPAIFPNKGGIIAFLDDIPPAPSGPYANDAAAAAGGVPINGLYYQGSGAVLVRLA